MDKKLQTILNSDPLKNIAFLGFFSAYPVLEYFVEGNSVIIFGKSDHLWAHISSSSEDELKTILSKYHKKTKCYYSVEDWMIPLIMQYGTEDWIMKTNRFILQDNKEIDKPKNDIKKIDRSFAHFMYSNSDYKDYLTMEYIEDRLSKDISAGILVNNTLAAWGFTHDDGALGFLHVLEEFRKKGYGIDILLGLIQMRKKENKAVFGNIVPGNVASTRLVTKLGFKLDRRTSWIKLK